jgi:hypothetical protein
LGTERELAAGVGELGLYAGPFEMDGIAALLDLGPGQYAVGGEVDEAV